MEYDTIKKYLGGGRISPMGYQSGGYIPGVSQAMYHTGLTRDARKAEEEFKQQAKELEKEQKMRGLLGKGGSHLGMLIGAALAPATGGASLALSTIAAKGIGSALGSAAGDLVAGKAYGADIRASSTGLYGDSWDELSKNQNKLEGEVFNKALGRGASTAVSAGLGDIAKMGAGSLLGKAKFDLGLQPDMAGKVIDSTGNLTSIPTVDTSIMDNYFQSQGYQMGDQVKPVKMADFHDFSKEDSKLSHIAAMMKDRPELELRRDYNHRPTTTSEMMKRTSKKLFPDYFAKERYKPKHEAEGITKEEHSDALENLYGGSRESRYETKLSQMLGEAPNLSLKRGSGMDFDINNIQGVESPSLIGEEYALERDSRNMYNQMKELSRNLGVDIAKKEGRMGQVLGGLGLRMPESMDMDTSNVQPIYDYFKPPMRGGRGGYQGGGKVGGYSGGRGLLSIMPFSRRIV